MRSQSSAIASVAVGILVLHMTALPVRAQSAQLAAPQGAPQPVARVASLAAGSISGLVQDEKGAGIAGAVVSAVRPAQSGSGNASTTTDRAGRFELRTLLPGPYLLRAHVSGFVASRGQLVLVRPSERVSSSIALHHVADAADVATDPPPVLAAGFGVSAPAPPVVEPPESVGTQTGTPIGTGGTQPADPGDDHSEVAWRLRHARRGVLNDTTLPVDVANLLDGDGPAAGGFGQHRLFGRAAESSARFASSLFASAPVSGQVNLLTTGSFDTPLQLFSSDGFSRSIAYLSLHAPVGEHADWTVRGALTQGDVSSWIVAAAYTTRAPARHRYDIGLSYSTQQYEPGGPAALSDGLSASRSAGAAYGFDTFTISPAVAVTYGARVARYDYLSDPDLVSPRVALNWSPAEHFRINAVASRVEIAPGAEEFAPPVDAAVWLPPQRTFSSLTEDRPLEAERTNHVALGIERDILGAAVSLRTFHQHVAEQIATMFGVDLAGTPATQLGQYFVASAGDVDTSGWAAGLRTRSKRIHGSVEYSQTRAHWLAGDDVAYMLLFASPASRGGQERVQDVATTVEADMPETSTHVLVLYRVGNGFASIGDRSTIDSRFDVQVRQSLHFMDFSSARWEMLLAIRNVFREANLDSSVFDELLVVHPPKRIVGGLTLRF